MFKWNKLESLKIGWFSYVLFIPPNLVRNKPSNWLKRKIFHLLHQSGMWYDNRIKITKFYKHGFNWFLEWCYGRLPWN